MENDSIRSAGRNTLVDIWVDGKVRAICISNEAIGAFVGFDEAARMSERERCEFVRTNLHLLVTAVRGRLREDGAADAVVLEAGDLPRAGLSGERRKAERRKRERRQGASPKHGQPERRRGDRRQGERRTRPGKRD